MSVRQTATTRSTRRRSRSARDISVGRVRLPRCCAPVGAVRAATMPGGLLRRKRTTLVVKTGRLPATTVPVTTTTTQLCMATPISGRGQPSVATTRSTTPTVGRRRDEQARAGGRVAQRAYELRQRDVEPPTPPERQAVRMARNRPPVVEMADPAQGWPGLNPHAARVIVLSADRWDGTAGHDHGDF